jgi:hypothetical protein
MVDERARSGSRQGGGVSSPDLFRGADALRFAQLERILSEQRLGIRKPLHWSNFVFSGIY